MRRGGLQVGRGPPGGEGASRWGGGLQVRRGGLQVGRGPPGGEGASRWGGGL